MKIVRTRIAEVLIIEPEVFGDERGWFMESYNRTRFHEALTRIGLPLPRPFVQDNHSCSARGVLRGLHYQLAPHAQGKLVRVTRGAAFDVAVDLRLNSPTFGRWTGAELSAANRRLMWIPEGFAHGFLAREDDTEFLYKTTDRYARESEAAICWDDPDIAIAWPLSGPPIVNGKDAAAPGLAEQITQGRVFGPR